MSARAAQPSNRSTKPCLLIQHEKRTWVGGPAWKNQEDPCAFCCIIVEQGFVLIRLYNFKVRLIMSAIVNRLHVKDSQRMLRSSVLGPSTLCTGHRFVRPAWVLVHRAPSIKFERTPPPIMEVENTLCPSVKKQSFFRGPSRRPPGRAL